MDKSVSILGCGWLGMPLARHLIEHDWEVKGTTTSPEKLAELQGAGITPFLLDLNSPTVYPESLSGAGIMLSAIPPGTRRGDGKNHLRELAFLLRNISPDQRFAYISSSSVYPNSDGEFDESYELNEANTGNPVLFEAENMIRDHFSDAVILRPGGLMGYDRVSGKYFAGKTAPGKHQPVNYIHRDDAVYILHLALASRLNGTFNLVAPEHPSREEVYLVNSKLFGFPTPSFKDDGIQRIIKGHKIATQLNYNFKYPNPLKFHC